MGRITVKHYLNKRIIANHTLDSAEQKYPVYVRVIFNRKNTNFRSEIVTKPIITENDFLNDPEVRKEIDYEAEIIKSIIKIAVDILEDSFQLKKIPQLIELFKSPLSLLNHFEEDIITEIQTNVVAYISQKTNIANDSILSMINLWKCSNMEILKELIEKNIFSRAIESKIYFQDLLEKYSYQTYGDEISKWGASNTFNFYEWTFNGGKAKFIDYINSHKILKEDEIKNFITDLEDIVKSSISFYNDFNVLTSKSRNM